MTPGPAQLARLGTQAPLLLSLVFVVLVAWQLARLVWLVWPAGLRGEWQPPAPVAVPTPAVSRDYRRIIEAHLFGEAGAAPEPDIAAAAANAPDTSLDLKLRGAIAASDTKYSHAIIADGNGTEKVYFPGATLPGGAVLRSVEADRVILARGAQVEVLRLPRDSGTTGGGRAALSSLRPVAAPAPTPDVTAGAASFMEVVRPQPFMPNGQLRGYRVYPGPNRQKFTAIGLRPGDLVTEINGIALNNPAQGMEVFRSLSDSADVSVTLERNGQPEVLTINLSQIDALGGANQ